MRARDCIYAVTSSATGETTCYEPSKVTHTDRDDEDRATCCPDDDACPMAVPKHGQLAHE